MAAPSLQASLPRFPRGSVPWRLQVQGRAQCPAAALLTGVIGCDTKSIFAGGGSRFVLEKVPGINLYRIRMQASGVGTAGREVAVRCRRAGPAGENSA